MDIAQEDIDMYNTIKDESTTEVEEEKLLPGIYSQTVKNKVYCLEGRRRAPARVNLKSAVRVKVAGACIGNGSRLAEGAIGISYEDSRMSNISGRISVPGAMSSQKAELHAVVSALEDVYMNLFDLRLSSLHVLSDSAYTVMGCTVHAHEWIRNGYTAADGRPVINEKLFRRIHELIWCFNDIGIPIYFERISTYQNQKARELARKPFGSPSGGVNREAWVVAFTEKSFCNDRNMFQSMDWIKPLPVYSLSTEQTVTFAIGFGTVRLLARNSQGKNSVVFVHNVLYCPRLPTNLISTREFESVGETGTHVCGDTIAWRKEGESWLTVRLNKKFSGYFFPDAPSPKIPVLTFSVGVRGRIERWSS